MENAIETPTSLPVSEVKQSEMEYHARVFVDAHVHLHPCFDLSSLLAHAAKNFRRAAKRHESGGRFYGCLLLTESIGVDRFAEMRDAADKTWGSWQVNSGTHPDTLVATCEGEPSIAIVAGRQIQTREKLEMLAIGCVDHFGEGEPLMSVVEQGMEVARMCVVPWGFAKWSGHRGTVIQALINSQWSDRVFLGDNGGRLRYGEAPGLFGLAQQKGIPILPGTDPFPFPSHSERVGNFGFECAGTVKPERFDDDVLKLIAGSRRQPAVYGSLEGITGFVWNQAAIQIRNRLLKRK